ncbi:MAG TPA: hypothetical protein VGJ13_01465 [Pseudonocardiaceae bacterium]
MTARSAKLRVRAGSLGTLSELGSGGQGRVYELSGGAAALRTLPHPDLVYKEYDRSARAALDADVLDEMAQYAAQLAPGQEGLADRLAWPLITVEREGVVSGFVMRRAPQQFVVRLQLPRGEKLTLAEAQHLLNEKRFLADRQLPVHDRWRLQFLRDTADTLAQLHRSGITVGDLSPKNLLASFTTRPYCFFLDCDTMRTAGRSALPQVETTGWEIPKGEERATTASDAYKLALLAVRLFAGDQDSKDITALSAVYPPLGQLARRGISADPSVRPKPTEWLPALDAATPRATTSLPWERLGTGTNGVAPHMGAPTTVPAGLGRSGVPTGPPPPARASAPNHLGRMIGIAFVVLVIVLFMVSLLAPAENRPSGEQSSVTPGNTTTAPLPSDPAVAYAELNQQVMADSVEVRSSIAERWVPQLASARKGLVVNGVTFDYTDILQEHLALREKYPQARLVWSGDWPVFDGKDFFVTVLAVPFGTAQDANGWCDQQGIDGDHCFAKLLSQARRPAGTTGHR